MIENGTGTAAATEGAASSESSTGSPYNSPASQASTGAGQMPSNGMVNTSSDANNSMYSSTGGRRRSRRYRRK